MFEVSNSPECVDVGARWNVQGIFAEVADA